MSDERKDIWYEGYEARTSISIFDHVNPYNPLFNPIEYDLWIDGYEGINFPDTNEIW